MVKAYLRYVQKESFGLIASPNCNAIFLDSQCRLAATGCLENLAVWNLKQSVQLTVMKGENSCATCLVASPDRKHIAAGYENGGVKVWEAESGTLVLTLNGHRSAVTALQFNSTGALLVSGARDTEIIVWDVVGEAGLYRLRGHKGEITEVKFLFDSQYLVSSSKDTFLKIWDLSTQHCIQTLIGHRNEVWSFDISPDETRLISGSNDHELRVWNLRSPNEAKIKEEDEVDANSESRKARKLKSASSPSDSSAFASSSSLLFNAEEAAEQDIATFYGILKRLAGSSGGSGGAPSQRVEQIRFNSRGTLLGVSGSEKLLEMFAVRSADEVKRKVARRVKRAKEKKEKKAQLGKAAAKDEEEDEEEETDEAKLAMVTPTDEYATLLPLRCPTKLRAFCFSPQGWGSSTSASFSSSAFSSSNTSVYHERLLLTMQNNELVVYDIDSAKEDPFAKSLELDMAGHRSGVRCASMSSDDGLLMTASAEQIKVWNTRTQHCVRTLESGYGLCGMFAPGDRHVLLGTKTGEIQLFDISGAECIQTEKAHEGAVWTMDMRPDQRGFVTGGAGKEVKFWEFELVADPENPKSKRLGIVHTRTLQLTDDVLAVKHSPDGKFIGISLLDSTIRIFYEDSLKFFLSLYGHKLPALSIDISSDSTLLISASADKNVKIWGMDFGDCHKSMFAHQDSVMQVRFVKDTHYFFSVGKDKLLKYWDADKFEQILSLSGHQAEVWALAVSAIGDMVFTAGNDRSIRMWQQTDEQVFLDEERENALEQMFEQGLEREQQQQQATAVAGSGLAAPSESDKATRASLETLKAGERLIDCIDLAWAEVERMREFDRIMANYKTSLEKYEAEKKKQEQQKSTGKKQNGSAASNMFGLQQELVAPTKPAPAPENPLMLGKTADGFMLKMLKTVRTTDLEEALMVLPFEQITRLLHFLDSFIKKGWDVELSVRCLLFVLRIHQAQIVANQTLLELVHSLRTHARLRLRQQKDEFGFNLAAMKFLQQSIASDSNAFFFDETAAASASATSL